MIDTETGNYGNKTTAYRIPAQKETIENNFRQR